MSLQLVYRYYSSLSKNENMFKQSKLRKQKQSEKKKKFLPTGLFIAPRYQKWKQTCENNYL